MKPITIRVIRRGCGASRSPAEAMLGDQPMTTRVLLRNLAPSGMLVGLLVGSTFVAREAPMSPAAAVAAQAPAPGRGAAQGPIVVSPEVRADRRVTFRVLAPEAQKVELRSPGDIPGIGGRGVAPPQLTRNPEGVWEATFGPLPAGAYRYVFTVNGVTVVDSRNPMTSETNTTVYSLAVVPGSDVFDTKNVPHGAVASVYYHSTALGGIRRMHVYTPPGYEANRERYPVFYLLHGAGDVDDSWSSVGRAGFILDNLIAAGKAKPMIVVMPAGHVNGAGAALGAPVPAAAAQGMPGIGSGPDPFANDFLTDIVPYVEKNYRALTDRQSRAIAGLSMGGNQTLNIAIPHLDKFAYIGVYSSGIISGARGAAPDPAPPFAEAWEKQNLAALDNTAAKRGLNLLWFSTGKEDFLIDTTRSTVDLLKKHGFRPVFIESEGAHTWLNWRDYLAAFAPQLFQPQRSTTSEGR
jgi:enterochelin esterase family protein